jgi:hypothetical protein
MAQRIDLPGQATLFPDVDGGCNAPAAGAQGRCDNPVLELPRKPTCTSVEAARATGISERQIRNWVQDGTLLAVNAARCPVGAANGRESKIDRWRIVVRRAPGYDTERMRAFLTLDELVRRASNMEAE